MMKILILNFFFISFLIQAETYVLESSASLKFDDMKIRVNDISMTNYNNNITLDYLIDYSNSFNKFHVHGPAV